MQIEKVLLGVVYIYIYIYIYGISTELQVPK